MTKTQRFFETFDLALGRLIAGLLGAAGAFLLYVAWHIWGGPPTVVVIGIGGALVPLSAAMLYCRVTLLRLIAFFAPGFFWLSGPRTALPPPGFCPTSPENGDAAWKCSPFSPPPPRSF